MKVIEHLDRATRPLISFEIIPPLRGGRLDDLIRLILDLKRFDPPFIDITSHAAKKSYRQTESGMRTKISRKRPGTLGLCALIQHQYHIDTVPHLLCHGFTREETEDVLIELKYLGIENVMAIRGDSLDYEKSVAKHRTINPRAVDLVRQIAEMNTGRYLEEDLEDPEPTNFGIGIAGYPEKHAEAPDLRTDLEFTKAKVDAGAEYIVTQMFFDNRRFFEYEKQCRSIGIEVPIIPGLKILSSKRQLSTIPRVFEVDFPSDLRNEISAAKDEQVPEIGIDWARRQVEELFSRGVPAVHFFVMKSAGAITKLLEQLKL